VEREERKESEKEYQNKITILQEKMEKLVKEREKEVKDEWEGKTKENDIRYQNEVHKMQETIEKSLAENVKLECDKRTLE